MKAARQRSVVQKECEGIALIRNRVKCADCGSLMVRRISSKRNIKESWTCQNPECGKRLRISDGDLLQKVTILMNRIIENSELLIPKPKTKPIVLEVGNTSAMGSSSVRVKAVWVPP